MEKNGLMYIDKLGNEVFPGSPAVVDSCVPRSSYYQDPTERMIAEIHQAILDLRQEVHELRLAVVEMNRRQKLMEGDGK